MKSSRRASGSAGLGLCSYVDLLSNSGAPARIGDTLLVLLLSRIWCIIDSAASDRLFRDFEIGGTVYNSLDVWSATSLSPTEPIHTRSHNVHEHT